MSRLAHSPTTPSRLTTLGRLDPFSPQFQSMTLEKGAMVFHMLRWEMGDEGFQKFIRNLLSDYTDKSVRSRDVEEVAERVSQLQLSPFFAQWIDGTGAPQFQNKYTVYRLSNNKGFRTTGAIAQDLDLFKMPVELRIETDGKTENRKVDVAGTDSSFSVETFGRPRRITLDPQNWLLKSTPDLAVRVAVLRGQQLVAQGDLTGALVEYQKALDANKTSSLASYRIGEIFFQQRNQQSAANSFRDALRGDGDPQVGGGLVAHRTRPYLRLHRTTRTRGQRIPPSHPNQRQHPRRHQRGPQPHDPSLRVHQDGELKATATAPSSRAATTPWGGSFAW